MNEWVKEIKTYVQFFSLSPAWHDSNVFMKIHIIIHSDKEN